MYNILINKALKIKSRLAIFQRVRTAVLYMITGYNKTILEMLMKIR